MYNVYYKVKKVRGGHMAKVIDFNEYKSGIKRSKVYSPKQKDISQSGEPLVFVDVVLNRHQAKMLEKILVSQMYFHERRDDYEFVITYGLNTIDFNCLTTENKLSFHVYEIYYYTRIIEFYIDIFLKDSTENEYSLTFELYDIFTALEKENQELIDKFAKKDRLSKYETIVYLWF